MVYCPPEPLRNGRTALSLTLLESIDHLAPLILPPRLHCHRYHVWAPNRPLRPATSAYGREADLTHRPPPPEVPQPATAAPCGRSPAQSLWAMLLARLFESLPLVCSTCVAVRPPSPSLPRPRPCSDFSTTSATPPTRPGAARPVARRPGTTRSSTRYPAGTPWPYRSPSTSSTSGCRGRRLLSRVASSCRRRATPCTRHDRAPGKPGGKPPRPPSARTLPEPRPLQSPVLRCYFPPDSSAVRLDFPSPSPQVTVP